MDNLVKSVCISMFLASNPKGDPESLTPKPRGQIGMMPKWQLYENLAKAAILTIYKCQPMDNAPKTRTILMRVGSLIGSGRWRTADIYGAVGYDFYFDGASLPACADCWMELPSGEYLKANYQK